MAGASLLGLPPEVLLLVLRLSDNWDALRLTCRALRDAIDAHVRFVFAMAGAAAFRVSRGADADRPPHEVVVALDAPFLSGLQDAPLRLAPGVAPYLRQRGHSRDVVAAHLAKNVRWAHALNALERGRGVVCVRGLGRTGIAPCLGELATSRMFSACAAAALARMARDLHVELAARPAFLGEYLACAVYAMDDALLRTVDAVPAADLPRAQRGLLLRAVVAFLAGTPRPPPEFLLGIWHRSARHGLARARTLERWKLVAPDALARYLAAYLGALSGLCRRLNAQPAALMAPLAAFVSADALWPSSSALRVAWLLAGVLLHERAPDLAPHYMWPAPLAPGDLARHARLIWDTLMALAAPGEFRRSFLFCRTQSALGSLTPADVEAVLTEIPDLAGRSVVFAVHDGRVCECARLLLAWLGAGLAKARSECGCVTASLCAHLSVCPLGA